MILMSAEDEDAEFAGIPSAKNGDASDALIRGFGPHHL